MCNRSSITEFLLLAFTETRELQLLHFGLFLGIYLAALLGNGLILTAIACDHRLHTPMYFFLLNLALNDLGCISTTLACPGAGETWEQKPFVAAATCRHIVCTRREEQEQAQRPSAIPRGVMKASGAECLQVPLS
uniref:G-protein coupled receptors family 1 profile domain-containing protein n=1 Tax=Anas platyrhynchos TaxID=8839 RepID=A0A8B9QXR9_ANAPL